MNKLLSALAAGLMAIVCAPANAADLPARMPVKAPPIVASVYNWTGFYVGVHAGYAWGELTSANDPTIDHEPSGGLFGGQIGYNWQFNKIVFGIEADMAYSTVDGEDTTTFGPFTIVGTHDAKYLGTVRGRIGYAQDRVLFYATGGYAFSKIVGNLNVVGVISDSDTVHLKGWTVGGGIEYAFAQNWTARVEYLYVDFRPETTTMNLGFVFTDQIDKNLNIIRFAVNYKL
jgi:outer membrane immunogenic protein